MRRLPPWILFLLAVLAGLLIWIGIDKRDEAGPVPIILGCAWALLVLGSAPKVFSRD